jgi:excinuclease ABC subunit A
VRAGLGHLSLSRATATLSTGELQRARLGAAAGNQLAGVLYVLDEPTAGLHPADVAPLLALLRELVDAGNTLFVVEHDADTIRAADLVVEVGPGAGSEGGAVVFLGPPGALDHADTPTGRWLSGRERIPPAPPRVPWAPVVTLRGARGHNLRDVTARFPLRRLVGVGGVSGAGKSTLVEGTLGAALAVRLQAAHRDPLPFESLDGVETVRRLVRADAAGVGRSARSTPATVLKVWDAVRALYAKTTEAKVRGWGPERFSLAVPGGRCEACAGEGVQRVDLHYLPGMVIPCPVCEGRRFEEATLAATWKGASVADVLRMPAREARGFFGAVTAIAGPLAVMDELGLGYVPLGQPSDGLSGGEAQRLALARELGRPGEVDGTLYLLDEPTVGLHPADTAVLVAALRRLVDHGGSVIAVEHDPLFLAACDHVLVLGPGAGGAGGRIVGEGRPGELGVGELRGGGAA